MTPEIVKHLRPHLLLDYLLQTCMARTTALVFMLSGGDAQVQVKVSRKEGRLGCLPLLNKPASPESISTKKTNQLCVT